MQLRGRGRQRPAAEVASRVRRHAQGRAGGRRRRQRPGGPGPRRGRRGRPAGQGRVGSGDGWPRSATPKPTSATTWTPGTNSRTWCWPRKRSRARPGTASPKRTTRASSRRRGSTSCAPRCSTARAWTACPTRSPSSTACCTWTAWRGCTANPVTASRSWRSTGRPASRLGCRGQGCETRQGIVLYIVAEGVSGLRQRVRAWEEHAGQHMDVLFLPIAVQLLSFTDVSAVVMLATELEPVLIVVDTQARVTVGADENSAKDMGELVAAIDRIRQARRARGAARPPRGPGRREHARVDGAGGRGQHLGPLHQGRRVHAGWRTPSRRTRPNSSPSGSS